MTYRIVLPVAAFLALAACGGRDGDDGKARGNGDAAYDAAAAEALPAPEGAVGSVTGMPAQPGPGEVPLGAPPPVQAAGAPGADVASATVDPSAALSSDGVVIPAPPLPDAGPPPPAAAPTQAAAPSPDANAGTPEPRDEPAPSREFVVPEAPAATDAATTSTTFRTAPEAPPED